MSRRTEAETTYPVTGTSRVVLQDPTPICTFQDPIAQTVPDGGSFTQCQSGGPVAQEVFTTASITIDGRSVGSGPCAVLIPVSPDILDNVHATTTSVILLDESGDGLLQPGEQTDILIELLNIGPALLNPMGVLSSPPDGFNPLDLTVLTDTAFFPDFPELTDFGDCDNPPNVQPQLSLTAYTIVLPDDQEPNVGRVFNLHVDGNDGVPVEFDVPFVLGIGESCDSSTRSNKEKYDGLEGFLNPLDVHLVPRGNPVNYSSHNTNRGSNVPLKLKLKCGRATLTGAEIDPSPEIVSIVHETLGAQPRTNINGDNNSNPDDPLFVCGTSRCEYGLRTADLPAGIYVIGIKMPDSRVFEAGFTIDP